MTEPLGSTNGKIDLFVPGRLCLFGEHSDWAGQMRRFNAQIMPGQALVVCTEQGIHATVSASDMLKITTFDDNGNVIRAQYDMNIKELQAVASEGGFFSYIAGVAAYILNYNHVGGLEINVTEMSLPLKRGLSSSAAICTLTARAFNRIYGLNLTIRGEMEAAYGGEQLTPSRCGRLDQAVAYGRGIVNMIFDGDKLDVMPVKIGMPLYFVFADLNAKKDTIAILQNLNNAYPFPRTDEHRNLHELLGAKNRQIIGDVINALANGDAQCIGKLMTKAQELFDKYAAPLSPAELEAPILHKMLEDENIRALTYGGKGVGSQGDGAVQYIAGSEEDKETLVKYLRETHGLESYSVTVPKSTVIRKAVITLAGYGTRMFPATKALKKEFFPVVDTDNLVKPMLIILLESLADNGIEEICLVIRPGEEQLYMQLFEPLPEEHKNKLPENLRRYNERLTEIGNKIKFAYQEQALGFGHAVLQSSQFASGEPVLLLLGDHLFKSTSDKSCIMQVIDAFDKSESLTIGLFEISPDDVSHYGVAKIKDENFILQAIVEKPGLEYAAAELMHNGKYYGVFMYVLTEHVYTQLSDDFARFDNSGELQLTSALDSVLQRYGAIGVPVKGIRYDIGLPERYRQTVAKFGV